jgi:hypothetical protein
MLKYLLTLLVLGLSVVMAGCSGDSGVSDGSILGTVLVNRSGTGGTGAYGVQVRAERIDDVAIVRTAVSDVYGHYQIDKTPVGSYRLTFYLNGYATTPTNSVGQVYVEPGRVSQVPDVWVSSSISSGTAVLAMTVIDAVTGAAVSNATVTVGSSTVSGGSNGVYYLYVPVTSDSQGQPVAQRVLINDGAYLSGSEQPSTVTPIANQTVSVTVRVQPAQSNVQGVVKASLYSDLYRQQGLYSNISITSDSIDQAFLNPTIENSTGRFTIRVPGSSSSLSRRFGLVFSAQGFYVKVLSNLIAPLAGQTASLSSDVLLDPATMTLEGNVITSSGSIPAGTLDQVALLELGQTVGILNGTFFFSRVPIAVPLTVRATATNPYRPTSPTETGTVRVTLAENGTGRFILGAITTR